MEDKAKITKVSFDPLSREVVDAAFYIHQTMGAGLLESVYEECFEVELKKRNIPFQRQVGLPVYYDGVKLNTSLRLDLVVDNQIVVELKSLERVTNAHTAQILTYMRTGGFKTGLLINYGEPYFKQAVKRFVL
ncbi:MAG: GxxExxY protein [Rhodospirillales bacterium]|nr:GxxExxY protein [Rhodospirillales bacterium]MCB9995648.1 GxxExxY protein [Rhodospirillales bacterium]